MSDPVFSGRVSTVVYQSEDYRVLKVLLDSDGEGTTSPTPVSVTGYFPSQDVQVGSWVSFAAEWSNHPRYGRQLKVTRSPVSIPSWTESRVMSALGANGVGPQLRLKLKIHAQDHGVDLVELLDSGSLDGSDWDEMTAMFILSRWRTLRTHLEGARFLSEAGVPPKAIGKLRRILGDDLEALVTSDPWVLTRLAGVSFREADEVALRLGVSLDKPERMRGAVMTAVRGVEQEGHLYAFTGQVMRSVQKMIPGNVTPDQVASAIRYLVQQKQLRAERHPEDNSVVLYLSWNHEMETACAEMLKQRISEAVPQIQPEVAQKALAGWAQARDVSLTETQRLAAFRALTEPISVLTGLPGTGKTTTLQGAVSVLKDSGVPFLLVAPTGIAAKRLSSVTIAPASTVHRAFSAKGSREEEMGERSATYVGIVGSDHSKSGDEDTKSQTWEYGPDNHHPAQVVIVDESSMLDLHMLYRLLQGTKPTCRLVFVGDPFQLPSVGAGDVLRGLASCGAFKHTHLSEIFRQEDTSGIVLAAHDIHAGRTPDMSLSDFTLIEAEDEQQASSIIMAEVRRLFADRENFQVLSPRHAGDAGVTNLNEVLRVTINPPSPGVVERNLAGSVVRESDRIMVVKNDYIMGVYNGDVGKVSRIDIRDKKLVVRVFSDPSQPQHEVVYDLTKGTPPIRLAYAQTIHKSQGQEYDVIVVPVLSSFGRQLQRNLLYTAITRAKKRVILVGDADAVRKAVQNNRADKRNTLLAYRLGGSALTTFGY